MLPQSVKTRHKAMYDFESCYDQLCSLQASVPLRLVKTHLPEGVIDINGDKVRMLDWAPILDSIKINKNLKYIAIKSFFHLSSSNSGKKTHYFKRKTPAICSKDVTQWLVTSLRSCLMVTSALRCLDLQGVPLRERDISILSNGIEKNTSLCFISLNYCQVADKGVQTFCQSIRNHPSLSHIALCGCNIAKKGTLAIAKLIKHQSIVRHGEAWAESLRYRTPNLNCMGGIRRISLNCNPMIGDEGIEAFHEALKDDLWLKALDFQLCGISTKGALSLLETMHYNRTLVVLDVRQNPMIDSTTLRTLLGRVLINAKGNDEIDYPWVKAESPKDPYCTKKYRSPKTSNRNFSKKALAKPNKSPSSENLSNKAKNKLHPKYKSSLAWQAAVNSSRRNYSAVEHKDQAKFNVIYQSDEFSNQEPTESNFDTESLKDSSFLDESSLSPHQSQAFIKQLKIELINSQRKLQAALENEKMLNAKILTLEVENARLKKDFTASFENSKLKSRVEDEAFLDSIEKSFNKFHDFLNKLHEAGMGSLAAEAGFDEDFLLPPSKPSLDAQTVHNKSSHQHPKSPLLSEPNFNRNLTSPRPKVTPSSKISKNRNLSSPLPKTTPHSPMTKNKNPASLRSKTMSSFKTNQNKIISSVKPKDVSASEIKIDEKLFHPQITEKEEPENEVALAIEDLYERNLSDHDETHEVKVVKKKSSNSVAEKESFDFIQKTSSSSVAKKSSSDSVVKKSSSDSVVKKSSSDSVVKKSSSDSVVKKLSSDSVVKKSSSVSTATVQMPSGGEQKADMADASYSNDTFVTSKSSSSLNLSETASDRGERSSSSSSIKENFSRSSTSTKDSF